MLKSVSFSMDIIIKASSLLYKYLYYIFTIIINNNDDATRRVFKIYTVVLTLYSYFSIATQSYTTMSQSEYSSRGSARKASGRARVIRNTNNSLYTIK